MIEVFILGVAGAMAVLSWYLMQSLGGAYARYRQAFKQQASERMGEFFLFLDPSQLWLANLAAGAVVSLAGYIAFGNAWLSAAAGAAALAAPQYGIRRVRLRRLRNFDRQLPDMLMALSGALRAGSGMQAALRHIVAQSPIPLSQEFGLMLRQQRMGVPFEHALGGLYRRMPTEGMGLLASSLKIAAQSGGNLAETLEGIADTLRARLHLLGRIHALTSQGRLQAWIMACLPAVLALALHYLDPAAMAALWETPLGWSVLGIIVLLEAVGIFFILRIVSIQV
ncbi:type II secretion system F family protein [Pollutimonas sp. M17]|uniref:type II secretion system F family protein n=1 Tax=Pollutimonas sp. M17 TaxID=2962065 RepID=UPI0021F3D6AF|nr:type II secretion system F family protein [Pollutimonas sp. M17]UYO92291.1 type II secretion system F family protein [Pollutimonas sp. M17]